MQINNIGAHKQIADIKQTKSLKKDNVTFGNNMQQLPSTYSAGVSQINSNLPIGYTKLGEISIPNLKEKASIFRLANGQKIVILPKKGPTMINTTFNVGSLNETENIRGMSHYIEHNLFNGSKGLAPKEYDKRVSNLGGYTNASTSFCTTDYYLSMQLLDNSFLEEGIKINAAQTQFPTFPPEQLEKEKEAVKSEIDVYKDSIEDVAQSKMLKNLFNIDTQSTNFILGTKQNINSFDQQKVLDYYNTWYTPDNTITVITGDVDVNETINLASKYYNKPADFSRINQRHYEPLTYTQQPIRKDFVQKGSSYSHISMGFAVPENTTEAEKTAINVLKSILSSPNSRLSKALDKYGLNPMFYSNKMQNKPNSAEALCLDISLPEEQVEEILKILYEEINHIANNPPTFEEFQDIKTAKLRGLEESAEYSEVINSTLTSMVLDNDYNYFENEKYFLNSLTPYDISNVARKFMDLNKVSIAIGHAEGTTNEAINNNYAKNKKPAQVSFGSSKPLNDLHNEIGSIREFKLWNNIETAIIDAPSVGQSTLKMSIQTDTMKDVSSPALSVLNELLNRGSAITGVDNFNKNLSRNNISIGFDANSEGINVFAYFNDEKMQHTLSTIKEILNMPNFTEAEFQRAKQNIKENLLSSNKSANDLLYKELFKGVKIYDTKEEQLAELDALTLADIQNLYSRIMANSQCEVTCATNIDEKPYMQDILNRELSTGLPVFQSAIINREANTKLYSPNTTAKIITDVEQRAQAEIIQAYTFPESYNAEDEVKIKLLNIILGEGMSSRLFTSLREKEKLCYSVRSRLSYKNDTGIIKLSTATTTDPETKGEGSPENAIKAINAFNQNVEDLKTKGVTEEELKQAKTKLKTNILNNREANADITSQMHDFRNSAYGFKHLEETFRLIDEITVEDLKATANFVFKNPPVTSIIASKKTLDELNLNK